MTPTSESMYCSFLLCSCTRSVFISITNSSDCCSDSQNAPGLPWACRREEGGAALSQWGLAEIRWEACPAPRPRPLAAHLQVPLQVPLEGRQLHLLLQLLVVLQLRLQLLQLPLQASTHITLSGAARDFLSSQGTSCLL